MQSKWLNNTIEIILVVLLCGMALPIKARQTTDLQHYIGISLGGGEANECQPGVQLHALPGWGANFGLAYHLQKGMWLFSIGLEAGAQGVQMEMPQYYDALPYQNAQHPQLDGGEYRYNYVGQVEQNQNVMASLPIEVGIDLEPVYIVVGIAPRYMIMTPYRLTTDLYTSIAETGYEVTTEDGQAQEFIDLGAYPMAKYEAEGKRVEPVQLVSKLEVGAYLPIKSKHRLRLGAYCQFGARMRGAKEQISTYHQYEYPYMLGVSPFAWQDVVQHNVQWQPLVSNQKYAPNPVNVEVGVRMTCLLNIHKSHICMCYPQYR